MREATHMIMESTAKYIMSRDGYGQIANSAKPVTETKFVVIGFVQK